jgi:hypothetical protein
MSANLFFNDILTVNGESKRISLPEIPAEGRVSYAIDVTENKTIEWKEMLYIRGWAFSRDIVDRNFSIALTLQEQNETLIIFQTTQMTRPDLHIGIKNVGFNLDQSGFEVFIPKDLLQKHKYKLGFIIKNDTKSIYSPAKYMISDSNVMPVI